MSIVDQNTTNNLALRVGQNNDKLNNPIQNPECSPSVMKLLAISLPIAAVLLFAAIFVPVYVVSKQKHDFNIILTNHTETQATDAVTDAATTVATDSSEYDEFIENITNITYATLTPKGGYDHIFIFLGGIAETSTKYFDFFKSESTFVPKGTKIYSLSGQPRQMQFVIDIYKVSDPVPGWFNIDSAGNLYPTRNNFTEAQESLNLVLDEIDRIKNTENIDYKKLYLGGFSQGAMMTNYILLNSRHELGGYIAFSGYVFDHEFFTNLVLYTLSDIQLAKLEARKNYHIIASNSFADNVVLYNFANEGYRNYFYNYTAFKLYNFGGLGHVFLEQPTHEDVRNWLKKRMGK